MVMFSYLASQLPNLIETTQFENPRSAYVSRAYMPHWQRSFAEKEKKSGHRQETQ